MSVLSVMRFLVTHFITSTHNTVLDRIDFSGLPDELPSSSMVEPVTFLPQPNGVALHI